MKKEYFMKWFDEGSISIPNLLLTNYRNIGIDEKECMLLIHIHSFIERGNSFPTPQQLSDRMTISVEHCMETLQKLIQTGLLLIEKHEEASIHSESYSLKPLWERLVLTAYQNEQMKNKKNNEDDIYSMFEQEFGRPLSPIECETLAMWIDQDQHSTALIKAALKESVLSGKLNFRYIDRILLEWKKNGVKTVQQAHSYGEKFRKYNVNKSQLQKGDSKQKKEIDYPFYNWL